MKIICLDTVGVALFKSRKTGIHPIIKLPNHLTFTKSHNCDPVAVQSAWITAAPSAEEES